MSVTKKILLSALLITVGIILGYVENLFLPIMPLYGLKIGFSNLVVIYTLYELGVRDAIIIGGLKAVLSGVVFSGVMSITYSVVGICFSIFIMNIVKQKPVFSEIGVSVLGSGMFQVGQILVACLVLKSYAPIYYLAYLLIGSVPCGIVSGILVKILRNNLKLFKEFRNE